MDLTMKPSLDHQETDPSVAFEKLKLLAKLKEQMREKDSTEERLVAEFSRLKSEEDCLKDYSEEMKLLQHEKMVHVEELRLIHSDISAMESVIKTSQSEMAKLASNSKDLYAKHQKLVDEITKAEKELGLDLSPNLLKSNLEDLGITPDLFGNVSNSRLGPDQLSIHLGSSSVNDIEHIGTSESGLMMGESAASATNFDALKTNLFASHNPASLNLNLAATQTAFQAHLENFFKQHRKMTGARSLVNHQPITMPNHAFASRPSMTSTGVMHNNSAAVSPQHQIIRQHPAPMKACLSCHQQIHRNAPICPLCKAKSRSQNPKKPKRRPEDL